MLSYQHIYHAGSFADVHKHALLVRTLTSLKNKMPRLFLLDTHSGRGLYDLTAEEALKTGECRNGISGMKIDGAEKNPATDYFDLIKKHNPSGEIVFYPGSPQIAKDMLRAGDRMIFAELHPGEFAKLQSLYMESSNIKAVMKDGFAVLAENIPPQERRGIVIIDPSYEIKTDYTDLPRHVGSAFRKWPQGVFFIWYPILTSEPHQLMLTALRSTAVKDVLVSEIRLENVPKEGFAMYGSGVAIVNSPLSEPSVGELTQYLVAHLPDKALAEVFWLDNKQISTETGLLENSR